MHNTYRIICYHTVPYGSSKGSEKLCHLLSSCQSVQITSFTQGILGSRASPVRTHVDKRADGVPLRALRLYKEPWAVNALVGLRLPAFLAPLALPELVLRGCGDVQNIWWFPKSRCPGD